nr:MAG TPA: hypothetical protein [Caudoviricetes sp.]DAJ56328.1 MAG TPA: hypothetical protein [Bacteriophage sp.]DAU43375.1 MAG TPA: hypothetical protein [Caudoviricetes sp.]
MLSVLTNLVISSLGGITQSSRLYNSLCLLYSNLPFLY